MKKGGRQDTVSSVTFGLAFALRIMEAREYCYADARTDFGMCLRSYWRWIARLRSAGMVLETQKPWDGRPAGYIKFVAVDVRMFSDASVAA